MYRSAHEPSTMSRNFVNDLYIQKIGAAMATGGTVMAPGDKLDPSRDKLGIQGQSLLTTRSQDGSLSVHSSDMSPSGSRPSTATSGEQPDNAAFGSISIPPEAVGVLETVINMNKALEQQIDALRMRLTVESKNHDTERSKIINEKEKEINKKENEIGELKDSLGRREERITVLERDNRSKAIHIEQKEREIGDLKDLVQQTEEYTLQLQKQVGKLKGGKHKSDGGTNDQDEELQKLKKELVSMKDKITSMETELGKAKRVIDQQTGKLKGMENEKVALSDKFKEELERAGRAMRSEVERMREVMKQQYMEMRNLREQNVEISSDVRDIKDLLLKTTIKPEPVVKIRHTERLDANFKSPRPMQKSPNYGMRAPMTSRPTATVKTGGTSAVRSSIPTSLTKAGYGTTKGAAALPTIPNSEHTAGRWVPTSTRQSTIKSAKMRKN